MLKDFYIYADESGDFFVLYPDFQRFLKVLDNGSKTYNDPARKALVKDFSNLEHCISEINRICGDHVIFKNEAVLAARAHLKSVTEVIATQRRELHLPASKEDLLFQGAEGQIYEYSHNFADLNVITPFMCAFKNPQFAELFASKRKTDSISIDYFSELCAGTAYIPERAKVQSALSNCVRHLNQKFPDFGGLNFTRENDGASRAFEKSLKRDYNKCMGELKNLLVVNPEVSWDGLSAFDHGREFSLCSLSNYEDRDWKKIHDILRGSNYEFEQQNRQQIEGYVIQNS